MDCHTSSAIVQNRRGSSRIARDLSRSSKIVGSSRLSVPQDHKIQRSSEITEMVEERWMVAVMIRRDGWVSSGIVEEIIGSSTPPVWAEVRFVEICRSASS